MGYILFHAFRIADHPPGYEMRKARNLNIDRDADVECYRCVVGKGEKKEKLAEVLLDPLCDPAERTIILVKSRLTADFVALYLSTTIGLPVNNIHEERQMDEMEKAVVEFRSGDKPILVVTPACTHDLVLALGTRDVAHIINFDTLEDVDKLLLLIGYWDNPGKLTTFEEPSVTFRMHGI